MKRYSLNFGKKERVLNYACQTYQLSRPNKVGAVMALIRNCQPSSFEEWQSWYFENAYTVGKNPTKITNESLKELGERLYAKITEVVIPEWEAAFRELTEQDCIDYIYNLTINRTYDGYIREKSVINDGLAKIFPDITFEESDPELDHAGDIDYIAKVGESDRHTNQADNCKCQFRKLFSNGTDESKFRIIQRTIWRECIHSVQLRWRNRQ